MNRWMKRLSDHYELGRRRYAVDRLMIVFGIDGTLEVLARLDWVDSRLWFHARVASLGDPPFCGPLGFPPSAQNPRPPRSLRF